MGFDYDGLISKMRQFNEERARTLAAAEANGHRDLAEQMRRSIAGCTERITEIEEIRDNQSA